MHYNSLRRASLRTLGTLRTLRTLVAPPTVHEVKMKKSFILFTTFCLFFLISCGNSSKNEDNTDSGEPQNDEDSVNTDTDLPDDSDSATDTDDTDTSSEQNDGDSTQTDEEHVAPDDAIDLSETGTANCYIVRTEGEYSFDATVRGNGKKAEDIDFTNKKLNPAEVKLVWQSNKNGLIDSLSLKDGRINFSAKNLGGNALVAALDEAGNIIWSWHIWLSDEDILDVKTADGVMVMDRNLGATSLDFESPASHGLLYQWGRKDPFPASPVVSGGTTSTMPGTVYDAAGNEVEIAHSSWENSDSNTLEYAVSNPTTVLSNKSQFAECRDWLRKEFSNPALWGGSDGEKSLFDPCPAGYRVPKLGTFDFFTSSGGYETNIAGFSVYDINADGVIDGNDYRNGWHILLDQASDSYSYFPAATRYDGSYAMLMGSKAGLWGNYWYAEADDSEDSSVPCGAYALAFQFEDSVSASPKAVGGRADGYSVRCMREFSE